MSNLDEHALQTSALAAAREAVAGNTTAAKAHLQSAFDRLHEAREYFYPLDARLLDLTLVAPSTLGQALRDELADGLPRNLLVSGEVIEEIAGREPETLDVLKRCWPAARSRLSAASTANFPCRCSIRRQSQAISPADWRSTRSCCSSGPWSSAVAVSG